MMSPLSPSKVPKQRYMNVDKRQNKNVNDTMKLQKFVHNISILRGLNNDIQGIAEEPDDGTESLEKINDKIQLKDNELNHFKPLQFKVNKPSPIVIQDPNIHAVAQLKIPTKSSNDTSEILPSKKPPGSTTTTNRRTNWFQTNESKERYENTGPSSYKKKIGGTCET